MAKEIGVVVANIGQFGPTTNRFLESPAANEIAVFFLVQRDACQRTTVGQIEVQICPSRVSQLGFCRDSV